MQMAKQLSLYAATCEELYEKQLEGPEDRWKKLSFTGSTRQ